MGYSWPKCLSFGTFVVSLLCRHIEKKTIPHFVRHLGCKRFGYQTQRYFLQPLSTPIPAILWETGGLCMSSHINLRKLLFYHHLVSLDDSSVASKVARLATQAGYPGLVREYEQLCKQYKLPCACQTTV